MVRGDKSGQMKLSFGMIFSIILIVAFVTFAVYAIITFLGVQEIAKVAIFRDNLQEDINKIWRKYMIQKGITRVDLSQIKDSDIPYYNNPLERIRFF